MSKAVFPKKLADALKQRLKEVKVTATVDSERVGQTLLHRFMVLSDDFLEMRPSERQDLVWRIADDVLDAKERFLVSMIVTLAPSEIAVKPAARRKAS